MFVLKVDCLITPNACHSELTNEFLVFKFLSSQDWYLMYNSQLTEHDVIKNKQTIVMFGGGTRSYMNVKLIQQMVGY